MYEQAQVAGARESLGRSPAGPVNPDSSTSIAADRVRNARTRLAGIAERIDTVVVRLLGPEKPVLTPTNPAMPSGTLDEIHNAIEGLVEVIATLEGQVERLQRV